MPSGTPTSAATGSTGLSVPGAVATGVLNSALRIPHSALKPSVQILVSPAKKLAIFVHGCFWHRCPKCDYKLPKNNTEFWQAKFDRNVARDEQKRIDLQNNGWKVITVWE